MRRNLAILMLILNATLASAAEDRHIVNGTAARTEFFKLKKTGTFTRYWDDGDALPWSKSLSIVYLETAAKDGRTCFFAVKEDHGVQSNAPTFFLCADNSKSAPSQCSHRNRCYDPLPSIGVGNLKTTPTESIAMFSQPAEYPKDLALEYEWTYSGGNGHPLEDR